MTCRHWTESESLSIHSSTILVRLRLSLHSIHLIVCRSNLSLYFDDYWMRSFVFQSTMYLHRRLEYHGPLIFFDSFSVNSSHTSNLHSYNLSRCWYSWSSEVASFWLVKTTDQWIMRYCKVWFCDCTIIFLSLLQTMIGFHLFLQLGTSINCW